MTHDLAQFLLYGAILLVLSPILGFYMASVFAGEANILTRVLGPVERGFYRLAGIDPAREQHWTRYAMAALVVNAVGFLVLYAVLRLQHQLPWNPQNLPAPSPDLSFNTAVSFITNTNWQAYGGEITLSYFSQMVGLTVQNFVSAGVGIAVAIAVIRGFAGRNIRSIGNFYVDLTRSILYILLPLSLAAAIFLVWQGVPQNFDPYVTAHTLNGGQQIIAQGPVASQIAIKQLGTNGGGFFNANSAHPYENPTPLSNLLEMVFIILIPAAFCFTFGRMVKDRRQGRAIFIAMTVLLVAGLAVIYASEITGNPEFSHLPVNQSAGNMEGKEVRFGVGNSALWAELTTVASNGSVNSMHESFKPLSGLVEMVNIELGEIIFGGVGSGLYGMLLFVILTVFIAGLMVGRTPEYLGKKIEAKEVKLAMLALLSMPVCILGLGSLATIFPAALTSVSAKGPHGLSEILYAYTSATGNNGSAFAGFNANTPYQNTMLGLCMMLGRFAFIVPMLAVAGSLGAKNTVPVSAGTFPTHTLLFIVLLISVILIVGGLTYFPVLALGPVAEHFSMIHGQFF